VFSCAPVFSIGCEIKYLSRGNYTTSILSDTLKIQLNPELLPYSPKYIFPVPLPSCLFIVMIATTVSIVHDDHRIELFGESLRKSLKNKITEDVETI